MIKQSICENYFFNWEKKFLIELKKIIKFTTIQEINFYLILGIFAWLIPFPNHNKFFKNYYYCAMRKQATDAFCYISYN